MRGKPGANGAVVMGERIIPAHAGQTTRVYRKHVETADHPRACGANRRCAMVRQLAYGSSPRMRGKLSPTTSRYNFPRIIPAHAGQTAPYVHRTFCRADHPRACGANGGANCRRWHAIGSSPRMRGKHAVAGAARRVVRIIPAHAGQTSGLTYPMPSVADHPRACGANDFISDIVASLCGSSPRMRGKPERLFVRACRPRIIPAHAGQTGERPSNARPLADHPRACGANLQLVEGFGGSFFGSSPRMRGKLLNCATPVEILRIIPAHAGQTP